MQVGKTKDLQGGSHQRAALRYPLEDAELCLPQTMPPSSYQVATPLCNAGCHLESHSIYFIFSHSFEVVELKEPFDNGFDAGIRLHTLNPQNFSVCSQF